MGGSGSGGVMTEQHVKGTVKFGGGSLMMWGCMTAQGVGYACRILSMKDCPSVVMFTNKSPYIQYYSPYHYRM